MQAESIVERDGGGGGDLGDSVVFGLAAALELGGEQGAERADLDVTVCTWNEYITLQSGRTSPDQAHQQQQLFPAQQHLPGATLGNSPRTVARRGNGLGHALGAQHRVFRHPHRPPLAAEEAALAKGWRTRPRKGPAAASLGERSLRPTRVWTREESI